MGQLDNSCVYINKVGTFGVNCASYWATHHLVGRCPIDMLLYADDLESLATTRSKRIAIVLSYCYLTALGYPFKWSKTRGGYRVEWLGMETEYSSSRLGLTEKRANWLVAWYGRRSGPAMLLLSAWTGRPQHALSCSKGRSRSRSGSGSRRSRKRRRNRRSRRNR